jgi:hypothetical protein
MTRASGEPRFAEDPQPGQRQERVSGRDLAAPRTRPAAVVYLVGLLALYGGVVGVIALDSAGPTCDGAGCSTFHPGLRLAAVAAALGFAVLIVLAFHVTRGYDRRTRSVGDSRRVAARGWPLAWNYLAAGLVLPTALRVLRRPAGDQGDGRAG